MKVKQALSQTPSLPTEWRQFIRIQLHDLSYPLIYEIVSEELITLDKMKAHLKLVDDYKHVNGSGGFDEKKDTLEFIGPFPRVYIPKFPESLPEKE